MGLRQSVGGSFLVRVIAAALLVAMAVLMIAVSRQDSATVDETTYLGAGYTFWQGYRYYLSADHPPLDQLLDSLPLLAMDVHLSDDAQALLSRRAGYPWTLTWSDEMQPLETLFPQGRDNWYFWAIPEGQLFGQIFVYDGANDAEAMMFAGRSMQVGLTLLAGVFIFWWAERLGGPTAALIALATYMANPLVLGYGHLIITDVGAMVMIPVAVFALGRFVEQPGRTTALWAGAIVACCLALEYKSLALGPILVALMCLYQFTSRPSWPHWKKFLRNCGWVALAGWLVLLIAYFPEWKFPPPISASQATQLGVPRWFQALRFVLIPRDFFKGLAIVLAQAYHPREAYLNGFWQNGGWWYYFPIALLLKVPIPILLLVVVTLGLLVGRIRQQEFSVLVPWLAAGVYLIISMSSKVNIGVRYTLPLMPLVSVGIATQWPAIAPRWRPLVWLLAGWLGVEALIAFPLYIQYFNEFGGGAQNGYKHLVDSNYDWGQDAKRLKRFLADRGITHIYLDYFGTQYNIEYLKIPNTRVDAEQARHLNDAWLVVSASELMRPEWAWLRESHSPAARVAYTLFVYQLGHTE
jgi:4-amino-4-deoxy-L-arabinose transferase-like glycosyltransferase